MFGGWGACLRSCLVVDCVVSFYRILSSAVPFVVVVSTPHCSLLVQHSPSCIHHPSLLSPYVTPCPVPVLTLPDSLPACYPSHPSHAPRPLMCRVPLYRISCTAARTRRTTLWCWNLTDALHRWRRGKGGSLRRPPVAEMRSNSIYCKPYIIFCEEDYSSSNQQQRVGRRRPNQGSNVSQPYSSHYDNSVGPSRVHSSIDVGPHTPGNERTHREMHEPL